MDQSQPIKVYGYIRVSTETQVKEGYGLETQTKAIEDYCISKGYELVDIFKDEGISGAKTKDCDEDETGTTIDREGLNDLLASLNKDINKIVVLNTSRLWRSDTVKILILRSLKKLKGDVISIEQSNYSIYNKNPNDFFINSMMELLDEFERLSINQKLAKGRKTKAIKGNKPAGTAPIGYKWNDKFIEVDQDKTELINLIFNKYLELKSLQKVKDYLDSKGYTTNQDKPFSKQSLSNILSNDFYIGIVTHADKKIKGEHEAIIEQDLFNQVQKSFKKGTT